MSHLNFHAILSKPIFFLHLKTRHLNFPRYFFRTDIFLKSLFFLRLITRHLNFHAIFSKPLFFLRLIMCHLNFHAILSKPIFFLCLITHHLNFHCYCKYIFFGKILLKKISVQFYNILSTYNVKIIIILYTFLKFANKN